MTRPDLPAVPVVVAEDMVRLKPDMSSSAGEEERRAEESEVGGARVALLPETLRMPLTAVGGAAAALISGGVKVVRGGELR